MIISSLFLGRSGTYNILGMQVEFQSDQPGFHNLSDNPIGKLGDNLLSNRVFNILTMGYLHTFVHEMGHALTYKIVSGGSSQVEIQISTSQLSGVTIHHGKNLSPIQHSIYLLGGPLANVAFSISLIFAAFALSAYM